MPWWEAQNHADRRPLLLQRGRIKAALRGWFEGRGFIEIEAGALVVSPGNEAHLHAFETRLTGPDGQGRPLYLHTSPEFAAKKLLAAGEEKIFDFARVFRNRERGRLHAPEFTMLEWYRAGEAVERVMEDTLALVRQAAGIAGSDVLRYRDRTCDPFAGATRLTVADAFRSDRFRIDVQTRASLAVRIAPEILATVLETLVENSVQASAGALVIRAEPQGDTVALSVADDGPGIAPADRERVFEPFFTGRREAGGAGMGLAIVRSLLAANGGAIAVQPSPAGALFVITLPLAD